MTIETKYNIGDEVWGVSHEEICTYEVCKLAKEKGFPQHPTEGDGECYYHWDGLRKIHSLCSIKVYFDDEFRHSDLFRAPTQSLLQRWLREEKGLHITLDYDLDFDDETFVYEWQIANKENFDNGGFEIHRYNSEESHSTYELALEDALKYALENLV